MEFTIFYIDALAATVQLKRNDNSNKKSQQQPPRKEHHSQQNRNYVHELVSAITMHDFLEREKERAFGSARGNTSLSPSDK